MNFGQAIEAMKNGKKVARAGWNGMEKGLKFDGDKLIGGDDVVSAFRESHKDAFKGTEPKPQFVGSAAGSQNPKADDEFIDTILGLK